MQIFAWIKDFVFLFFPQQCETCGASLVKAENVLCLNCLVDMPVTDYSKNDDNPVIQLFWGKQNIQMATALFLFGKGSKYRTLLHKLKYKNKPEIGVFLGKELGISLKRSKYFQNIDGIVPVPLHYSKLKKRGYNQSERIAVGISEVTGWTIYDDLIVRTKATETQTKKSKEERWSNVSGKFALQNPERANGLNLLLLDDVVTTGATLEACSEVLLTIDNMQLFVAVVAKA